jgi:hypothetical protein
MALIACTAACRTVQLSSVVARSRSQGRVASSPAQPAAIACTAAEAGRWLARHAGIEFQSERRHPPGP